MARCISAAAGGLTAGLIFSIGRRWANDRTGWLAALLFAAAPIPVREAHFATTDALATFLSALVVLSALGYTAAQDELLARRWFWVMAVTAGLATATKYNAGMVVPLGILAISLRRRRLFDRTIAKEIILFSAVTILTFLITNPYVLVQIREWKAALGATVYGLNVVHDGRLVIPFSTYLGQMLHPFMFGPGEIPGAIAFFCITNRQILAERERFFLCAL